MIDVQLNRTTRFVCVTVSTTPTTWLSSLCDNVALDLRKKNASYDNTPKSGRMKAFLTKTTRYKLKTRHPSVFFLFLINNYYFKNVSIINNP